MRSNGSERCLWTQTLGQRTLGQQWSHRIRKLTQQALPKEGGAKRKTATVNGRLEPMRQLSSFFCSGSKTFVVLVERSHSLSRTSGLLRDA